MEIQGVGDPVEVAQSNFEVLNEEVFKVIPTYQSGSPTSIVGHPSTGDHILNELWKDSLNAHWRCTVAGTPGTWRQERAAVVATPPASGTIPAGYQVLDASDRFRRKFHAGTYVFVPVDSTWEFLTGLTGGGAAALDGVPTVNIAVGIIVFFVLSGTLVGYRLTAGTDVESSPSVIRPDDYDGGTNAKVWKKVL